MYREENTRISPGLWRGTEAKQKAGSQPANRTGFILMLKLYVMMPGNPI